MLPTDELEKVEAAFWESKGKTWSRTLWRETAVTLFFTLRIQAPDLLYVTFFHASWKFIYSLLMHCSYRICRKSSMYDDHLRTR